MSAELEPPVANGSDVDALLRHEADAALAGAGPVGPVAPPVEAPVASKETADMCAMLLGVTFNQVLAPRSGDHWKLADEECTALGTAYGAVLDKYFPNLRTGPEAAAIIVTLAVLGPRVMAHVKAADEQKKPPAGETAAVAVVAHA
ncbi:MAG TPA: hypothetical protein VE907_12865 [Gammaproteobacteria bacterium]|nr:hypothetical protein [Gammaproteobacteria bacterium]